MNHSEAVERGAVERYLLGELSDSELAEFENHFFDCAQCVEELRTGAIFEENARAVFREELAGRASQPPGQVQRMPVSWWILLWQRPWTAAPALVAIALLCFSAYQALVVIPGLRGQLHEALAPQPVMSYVLPSQSRGEDRVVEITKDNRFFALYMDPIWPGSFREYLCSVEDIGGSTRLSVRVPAPPPGKPLQILLSRNQLSSGRYTVIVRNAATPDKPESELDRFSLILKLD